MIKENGQSPYPVLPVQIDDALTNGRVNVSVDAEKYTKLFAEQGLSSEKAQQLSVQISSEGEIYQRYSQEGHHSVYRFGYYDEKNREITLSLGAINYWYMMEYQKAHYAQVEFMNQDIPFNLTTKRLGQYLKHAPKERGIAFAKKLLTRKANKLANNTLVHEAKHAIDELQETKVQKVARKVQEGKEILITNGAALSVTLASFIGLQKTIPGTIENAVLSGGLGAVTKGVLKKKLFSESARRKRYFANAREVAARDFEKQVSRDERFDNIIQFEPDYEPGVIFVMRK